jgi:hypothetical protein
VTAIETTRTATTGITATPEPLTTTTTITTETTKSVTELADQPPVSPLCIEETDLQAFQIKLVEVISYTLLVRGAEAWVIDMVQEFCASLEEWRFHRCGFVHHFPSKGGKGTSR